MKVNGTAVMFYMKLVGQIMVQISSVRSQGKAKNVSLHRLSVHFSTQACDRTGLIWAIILINH